MIAMGNLLPQPCGHTIVNHIAGIHFEPDCIHGDLNNAEMRELGHAQHGLENYRFLGEFYRLPTSSNCKISGRVRPNDPAFRALLATALAADCPEPQGGIQWEHETCSIFVYPLGQRPGGTDEQVIANFTCNPPASYTAFLKNLPGILAQYQ